MPKIQKQMTIQYVGEDMKKLWLLCTLSGNGKWHDNFEKHLAVH